MNGFHRREDFHQKPFMDKIQATVPLIFAFIGSWTKRGSLWEMTHRKVRDATITEKLQLQQLCKQRQLCKFFTSNDLFYCIPMVH